MSGTDMTLFNHIYKNIDRPYANVDLSKMPSWDIVMNIMEHQAFEARRQIMAKYHNQQQQQQQADLMPQTVTNYSPYNYNHNDINGTNSAGSSEESDNSSCCSEEMDSSSAQSPMDSSATDSDIEIDVDNVEEEEDDYFLSSMDNIPITVLQLETKLREKEMHSS